MLSITKSKRGSMGMLTSAIVGFVVLAVVIVVGINIVNNLKANYTAGSAEANASQEVLDAYTTFTQYFGILALVIVAAVILFFLLRNLGGFGRG